MNKTGIGITALLIVGLVAAGVFALQPAQEALGKGKMNFQRQTPTAEQLQEKETRMAEMQAKQTVVQTAIDANDYNAWKTAIANCPRAEELTEKITEDNFGTYVEMHKAMQTAQEKAKELGLERGRGLGNSIKWSGRGMKGPRPINKQTPENAE